MEGDEPDVLVVDELPLEDVWRLLTLWPGEGFDAGSGAGLGFGFAVETDFTGGGDGVGFAGAGVAVVCAGCFVVGCLVSAFWIVFCVVLLLCLAVSLGFV